MGRTIKAAATKRGRFASKSKSGPRSRKVQRQKGPPTQNRTDRDNTVARTGSKLAAMVTMLQRPKGASIAELCKATGWQAHSVRGALSGTVKKKMGLSVTSAKSDGLRRYRLAN